MIVLFKQYPELGRLKVVPNDGCSCSYCALDHFGFAECGRLDKRDGHWSNPQGGCDQGNYHYVPVDKLITLKE